MQMLQVRGSVPRAPPPRISQDGPSLWAEPSVSHLCNKVDQAKGTYSSEQTSLCYATQRLPELPPRVRELTTAATVPTVQLSSCAGHHVERFDIVQPTRHSQLSASETPHSPDIFLVKVTLRCHFPSSDMTGIRGLKKTLKEK
uniref:Uncharacterized protein n=1 Tax=Molossus molossus TaxID=27622 RepID=A0A7J8E336_MOLMO|nr:hypothetical protein HJG59_009074 [Molossus molossus]